MEYSFANLTGAFHNLLIDTLGIPGWLTTTIECVLIGLGMLLAYSVLALFYIYFERKVCGIGMRGTRWRRTRRA